MSVTEGPEPPPARTDEGEVAAREEERRATFLELFFDLVFVFAITQVTALILSDTSAEGFARSLLVLALVWWAWSGFSWMTNQIDVESMFTRWSMLVAMAGTFFMALAVPDAWQERGDWFAASYFAVILVNIGLYVFGVRGDPALLRSVLRLAPFFLLAPTLVLVGGLLDDPARVALWIAALAVYVGGALDAGRNPWRVSPAHFSERHGLFVIIALGESVVAIGLGALEAHRDLELAGAVLVALAGTMALWWAYFDFGAAGVEQALRRVHGAARAMLARDVFTFLHFPMIAGIVLFAVAAKKTVEHATDPLSPAGRTALGAGIAMFMLAMAVGRFRMNRSVAWERLAAAAGAVLVASLVADLAAAAAIAIAVAVVALALAAESLRLRDTRASLRAHEP